MFALDNYILITLLLQVSNYPTPTVAATPQPNYNGPHDFLVLAIVTMILSALFFNLVSLVFGVPAVIFGILVSSRITEKEELY